MKTYSHPVLLLSSSIGIFHTFPITWIISPLFSYCIFFFYVGFLSQIFTNHRTAWEGGGHLFNSSLLLLPDSQTLRHYLGNYCRELTSAHSQQSDSNREPLVSKCKLLTTKLHALMKWSSPGKRQSIFSQIPLQYFNFSYLPQNGMKDSKSHC